MLKRVLRDRLTIGVSLAVTLAVLGGACSSSSNKVSTKSTATTAAGKPATGTPVDIWNITSLTGQGPQYWPESSAGMKAAAQAINASGGINNHPIVIKQCDEQWNPNISADCGRQAVADHALAVVGESALGNYDPIIYAAGIPCVGCQGATTSETSSDLYFPIGGAGATRQFGQGWILGVLGKKSIASAYADIPAVGNLSKYVQQGYNIAGGGTFNAVAIPPKATDLSPYALEASKSEGIVTVLGNTQAQQMVVDGRKLGTKATFVIPYADYTPSWVSATGTQDGLIYESAYIPVQTNDPRVNQIKQEYTASGTTQPLDEFAYDGWSAIHIIANVMAKAPSVTAADLVPALKNAGTIDIGIAAPFSWQTPIPDFLPTHLYSTKAYFVIFKGATALPVFQDFQDVRQPPTSKIVNAP